MYQHVRKLKVRQARGAHKPVSSLAFSTPIYTHCVRLVSCIILPLTLGVLPTLAFANDRDTNITSVTSGPALSSLDHEARGVLKAGEEAIIASGMTARLTSASYKPGQYFKSGALLARFDCTQQEAELSALTQAHQTLTLKYKNQDHLFKAGAAGQLDVSVARSEMQQAAAEREALKARLKHCSVYAPYAGIIVDKHVAAYETPAQNAPLYTVHKTGALEISVIIPSKWLRWLNEGEKFTFNVDETGAKLNGKVSRISAAVDPVSQTIEITGKPIGSTHGSLSGMSGVALFEYGTSK